MPRTIDYLVEEKLVHQSMPDATDELMPGVRWGDPWELFSPAYWFAQAHMSGNVGQGKSRYASHGSFEEAIGFCLLGGYGIKAELAQAAFCRCRDAGLFQRRESDASVWTGELSRPLNVGKRVQRYRFPNLKAQYLASAMAYAACGAHLTLSGRDLRTNLMGLRGVGYKTASWVSRNYLDCDDVAILDIHVFRAGTLCGLFKRGYTIERHYLQLEDLFLEFCNALKVRPAILDCLIWDEMRDAGSIPLRMLAEKLTS